MQLVIITGLSGSGKSVALKVLEDGAYYTTDNLPAKLLSGMVDFLHAAGYARVAVSIDARSGDTLAVPAAGDRPVRRDGRPAARRPAGRHHHRVGRAGCRPS